MGSHFGSVFGGFCLSEYQPSIKLIKWKFIGDQFEGIIDKHTKSVKHIKQTGWTYRHIGKVAGGYYLGSSFKWSVN